MTIIPIVFAFSNEYALPGWVSINSLIKSADPETKYNIYILHEDIEIQNILNFKKISNNSIHKIKFLDVSDKLTDLNYSNLKSHWPRILFARLFITKLIPEYEKIIVSDVDVLFKKDLATIFKKDLSNHHYGLVAAEKKDQNIKGHKRYKFYKNKFIYYSGFVIYNRIKMEEDKICNEFLIMIKRLKKNLKYELTDLILLNACSTSIYRIPFNYCVIESIILKDDIRNISEYSWLSQLYNHSDLKNFKKDPSIIHYTCHGEHREKPWNRIFPPQEYLSYINSSPYKYNWLVDVTLKKIIRKNKFFAIISNTKLYKVNVEKFVRIIALFYFKIFLKVKNKAINKFKGQVRSVFWKIIKIKKKSDRHNMMVNKYGNMSNEQIFGLIYKTKIWDVNSKVGFSSGPGSHDREIVVPYVNQIVNFLKNNKNLDVIDLGCGDFNIGSKLYKYSKNYIGIDVVKDLIKYNKTVYKSTNLTFKALDVVSEEIASGDCILIKEVFQHITNEEIKIILRKIIDFKFIIITESEPLFPFKPNKNKPKGPDCRTDIPSGIIIDKSPFNLKYKIKEELLRVKRVDRYIVTTLYQTY